MGRDGMVVVKVRWAVAFTLLLLIAIPVFAQLPTGTILGTVKDSTGAVVAGASVTVKNRDTGFSRTTTTGGDGSYRFSALPVGNYEEDVTNQGFSPERRTGLTLTVDQEAVVNVALNVGSTTQTVEISAGSTPGRHNQQQPRRVGKRAEDIGTAAERPQLPGPHGPANGSIERGKYGGHCPRVWRRYLHKQRRADSLQ